ncbi:hypothetical protein B296_00048009, partial [Ensete ventricosum]
VLKQVVKRGKEATTSPVKLNYPKSSISRMEVNFEERHSTIEANLLITKKGHRCETIDSKVMGMAAPWYHRGKTFLVLMERERLIVKGAEEIENVEANYKYRDKTEGQR